MRIPRIIGEWSELSNLYILVFYDLNPTMCEYVSHVIIIHQLSTIWIDRKGSFVNISPFRLLFFFFVYLKITDTYYLEMVDNFLDYLKQHNAKNSSIFSPIWLLKKNS